MAKKKRKKRRKKNPVNTVGTDGVTLLREFEPHGGTISQISFRPDGQQYVTASSDGTLKIWNTDTGTCERVLEGRSSVLFSCDWSPAGKSGGIVSSGGDGTVRIWEPETGSCVATLTGHLKSACTTAWSNDGKRIVSGSYDSTARIWNVATTNVTATSAETSDATFTEHDSDVNSCLFLEDGQHAVSGGDDANVRIWTIKSGNQVTKLPCGNEVWSVSIHPRGTEIAAACDDGTILVWSLRNSAGASGESSGLDSSAGESVGPTTLEGHTAAVKSCAYSPDGRLLASKSEDATVRLWRTDTWQTVAVWDEADPHNFFDKLCFHPTQPILATPGEGDQAVRLWKLDYGVLLGEERAAASKAVHYTTARIALVGDSGVGKTGLGWRIAHGEFKEHKSTHGQQFWVVDELGKRRDDGTQCEAVLWDFAGQDDYRLVHSLFLGEVDLGLLLFDPGRRDKPLAGVEFWLKQFRINPRKLLRTMLVAARCDRAQPSMSAEELNTFCDEKGIAGRYIATSAQSGQGVDELLTRVSELIPWDQYSKTVTTATFKRVKDFVLKLKEARDPAADAQEEKATVGQHVLVEPAELRTMLEADAADREFTDAEMMTAVRHLASHGYVAVCEQSDGDESILLFPDVLIGLASSMVNAARGNQQGLGALIENQLDSHRYRFPELLRLDPHERETLIQTAVRLFLKRNICFRESDVGGGRSFLVFPSLINEKRPKTGEAETFESTSYLVEGAVETVYPALVVLLGYTDHFSRTNQWQNHAQYEMDEGEVCGFHQITEHEGEAELVLYFGTKTPPDAQRLFRSLFERFLRGRDVNVTRYSPIKCACGEVIDRNVVMKQIRRGRDSMNCYDCGEPVPLPAAEDVISLRKSEDVRVEQENRVAQQRTEFQASLVTVKGILKDRGETKTPSCFISYAWGVPAQEKWVHQLADDLRDAGIHGLLDIKHNTPGTDIDDYIEEILETDFVVVVGTPKLLEKYKKKETDNVVTAELKLINTRKMQPNRFGRNGVVPVMLEGDAKTSLTPLLQNTVYVDFTDQQQYFDRILDLVLTLHGIPVDHPGIVALKRKRESLPGDRR